MSGRLRISDYDVLAFTFGFDNWREMKAFADAQQAKADNANGTRAHALRYRQLQAARK